MTVKLLVAALVVVSRSVAADLDADLETGRKLLAGIPALAEDFSKTIYMEMWVDGKLMGYETLSLKSSKKDNQIQLLQTRHGVMKFDNGVRSEIRLEGITDSRFRPSEMSLAVEVAGPDGRKRRSLERCALGPNRTEITVVEDGQTEKHERPLPEGAFVLGAEWLVQLIRIGSVPSFAWREFSPGASVLTCQLRRGEAENVPLRLESGVTGRGPGNYFDLTEKGELIAINQLRQKAVSKVVSPERFQKLVVQFK